MTTLNTLSPLQGLSQRIESMTILYHCKTHGCANGLLADAYRRCRWTKIKGARPDVIFDKDTTWWAYVQPEEYSRVTGYGTTLQGALQGLLDQLEIGPQQWMMACAAATLEQHMIADQPTNRNQQTTTKPDLSVYTFAQGSGSNYGSSSAPRLPNSLPHNPALVAQYATADAYFHDSQQLSESIVRGLRQNDADPMHRLISSSAAFAASIKRHQQESVMTPNYTGPLPSNFDNSVGFMSPAVSYGSVVSAATINPAVSQPFLQGAVTPNSFDQTISHRIGQPSAPVCQAAQTKQNFSSSSAHNTTVDIPQADRSKQSEDMRGESSQKTNSGVSERAQKRVHVEEYSQIIRVEPQSKAIKFEDQPPKIENEEHLQKIKVEERPSKKIKLEDSN